jgi:hypothetical protein
MAAYLLSYGSNVEKMLYLSPREGDVFFSPHGVFAIQVHYNIDPICSPKRISGTVVFINLLKLDGNKAGLLYSHGATVRASTLYKVNEVLKMLPHDADNKTIEGIWTITETENGFDFLKEIEEVHH